VNAETRAEVERVLTEIIQALTELTALLAQEKTAA
jgi:hypothetical protein